LGIDELLNTYPEISGAIMTLLPF